MTYQRSSNITGVNTLVNNPVGRGDYYAYRDAMGVVMSPDFLVEHNDFSRSMSSNVPNGWLAAIIDTSATAVMDSSTATGAVKIAGGGSASQGVSIYLNKGVQLTSGKRFFMECKLQTSTAADNDAQFGLTDLTATTNPEDLWTTTAANLVAFGLLHGSAYPTMLADKSNSGTSAQAQTVAALSDATDAILAIYYDGSALSGWVNGAKVLDWSGASTTIPTGVALSPFFGARCGTTTAGTTLFDWIRWVVER